MTDKFNEARANYSKAAQRDHERMCKMDEALYTAPVVDHERNQLRERVPLKPDKLAQRARKFLTLGAVYADRERGNPLHAPAAKWEDWLRSFMSPADVRTMKRLQAERKLACYREPREEE